MTAKILALATLLASSIAFSALANDDDDSDSASETTSESLPTVPKQLLSEFTADCKRYAQEDEIQATELKQYLLNCVNLELENLGYKKLDNLPPR